MLSDAAAAVSSTDQHRGPHQAQLATPRQECQGEGKEATQHHGEFAKLHDNRRLHHMAGPLLTPGFHPTSHSSCVFLFFLVVQQTCQEKQLQNYECQHQIQLMQTRLLEQTRIQQSQQGSGDITPAKCGPGDEPFLFLSLVAAPGVPLLPVSFLLVLSAAPLTVPVLLFPGA